MVICGIVSKKREVPEFSFLGHKVKNVDQQKPLLEMSSKRVVHSES